MTEGQMSFTVLTIY